MYALRSDGYAGPSEKCPASATEGLSLSGDQEQQGQHITGAPPFLTALAKDFVSQDFNQGVNFSSANLPRSPQVFRNTFPPYTKSGISKIFAGRSLLSIKRLLLERKISSERKKLLEML